MRADQRDSGSSSELLSDFRIISTQDLDDARLKVAEIFCPHQLVQKQTGGRLNLVHNRVIFDSVALNYMDYGCEVQITPGELDSFYLVQIPLSGGSIVTSNGATVQSNPRVATVPNATDYLSMTWLHRSPHFVVYVARSAVEQRAAELIGHKSTLPIRFELAMNLTDTQVRGWCELVALLRREAEAEEFSLHPQVRRQLTDSIITGLLSVQPHNLSAQLARQALPPCPRTIRSAIELCEHSPAGISTVSEMAAFAGVSIRALQLGFRQYVGLSPMQYLRDVRLQRVRDELQAPSSSSKTVGEVAYSWGFTHLGRFAAQYRKRFNENPSDTIRK